MIPSKSTADSALSKTFENGLESQSGAWEVRDEAIREVTEQHDERKPASHDRKSEGQT